MSEICGVCACPKSASPHFGALCCLACAAFFRRTVSLEITYACTAERQCRIHHELRMICRACRYAKCIEAGMKRQLVQKRREGGLAKRHRKRNAAGASDTDDASSTIVPSSSNVLNAHQQSEAEYSPVFDDQQFYAGVKDDHTNPAMHNPGMLSVYDDSALLKSLFGNVPVTQGLFPPSASSPGSPWSSCSSPLRIADMERQFGRDLVEHYVREERKANDRRRIMYTNHSLDRILDARGDIPFTKDSLHPFTAKYLRETTRVELLLAYEYTREIVGIERVTAADRTNIYKHCVLMFAVLDIGFFSTRFDDDIVVYTNGTFQSVRPEVNEAGWEAEEELDANAKKELFGELVQTLYNDLIVPMAKLNLSDVEFAITKALTLWRTCHFELSPIGRAIGVEHQEALIDGLHDLYRGRDDGAERMGTILLFISNFYGIFTVCVTTYVKFKIFDLVKIDALLHQLLLL